MKTIHSKALTILVALSLGTSLFANETKADITVEEAPKTAMATQTGALPTLGDEMPTDTFVIPNAPTLKPTNIITIRAIGLGVAPERAQSKAHAMALAKRSAIIDAYRQMGEKLHGIKINARDTVKDAIIKSSIVRTELYSVVRGGEIMETIYQDGLCQVEMEVKIDGRRWYKALTSAL